MVTGAGFSSELETLKFIDDAGGLGVDGFLLIVPTYYPVAYQSVYSFIAAA